MLVTKTIITTFPQTVQGKRMADEMEKRDKAQGSFRKRKETTISITIESFFSFSIEDEEI